MKLRGIDFGDVFNAAGALNFFGEGWWQTSAVDVWSGWEGATFVAKTTTLFPRLDPEEGLGNLRLNPRTLQTADWFPDCIWHDFRRCLTLNAVGLSGPGALDLLGRNKWQWLKHPFFLSFMSAEATREKRLEELRLFVEPLLRHKDHFFSRFGLQINISCPNVGLDPKSLVPEACASLDVAAVLGIPLVVKISLETKVQDAAAIAAHKQCDALCVGNVVQFGHLPEIIDWQGLFGTADPEESPLAKYGGGGLSGPPLLPVLGRWLQEFRRLNSQIPISACGGIFSVRDALWLLKERGATAIELSTVATHRPWRVPRIIWAVNHYYQEQRDKAARVVG